MNGSADREPEGRPEVFEMATAYSVSLLPVDHPEHDVFSLTVEWRGEGRWGVFCRGFCMDASGERDYEPIPSSREDDWLATHRFDLDTALALARAHVGEITVNGFTYLDALEMHRG